MSKSRLVWLLFAALTLLSVTALFYRYVILEDFDVETNEEEPILE